MAVRKIKVKVCQFQEEILRNLKIIASHISEL